MIIGSLGAEIGWEKLNLSHRTMLMGDPPLPTCWMTLEMRSPDSTRAQLKLVKSRLWVAETDRKRHGFSYKTMLMGGLPLQTHYSTTQSRCPGPSRTQCQNWSRSVNMVQQQAGKSWIFYTKMLTGGPSLQSCLSAFGQLRGCRKHAAFKPNCIYL